MKYKIKINSPEHSLKIQKHLFSLGYKWGDSSTELKNRKAAGIIVYKEFKDFFYMFTFNEWKDVAEFELIETVSYELKEIPKKEVVKIGEKSYYKDELEIALKNINPI